MTPGTEKGAALFHAVRPHVDGGEEGNDDDDDEFPGPEESKKGKGKGKRKAKNDD